MFDIGWSEMAIIMLVALVVIGPKDLPRLARTLGQWVAKGRAMAREFQRSLEDMAREAELDDVKREIEKAGRTNISKSIEETIDPTGEIGKAFDPTDTKDGTKAAAAKASDTKASDTKASGAKAPVASTANGGAEPEPATGKPEAKPAAKAESKRAGKPATKPAAKAETKRAAKAETKPAAKAGTKPAAKAETKPAAPESKTEPKETLPAEPR